MARAYIRADTCERHRTETSTPTICSKSIIYYAYDLGLKIYYYKIIVSNV